MLDYNAIAGDIGDLPSMPIVAIKSLELLQKPDMSIKELADTISMDPAISARILKITNSSVYGLLRKITTLHSALVVLGERTVKSLVLASSMCSVNKQYGLLEKLLWEESVGSAIASRFVSQSLNKGECEEAFLSGLFSNLGKVVRNNNNPAEYQELAEAQYNDGNTRFVDLERSYFSHPYNHVGAAVLHSWGIAELLVESVCQHIDVEMDSVNPDALLLAAVTNLGVNMCYKCGIGTRIPTEDMDLTGTPGGRYLKLDSDSAAELLEGFDAIYAESREAFNA
ncbi:MAG: HDOD domain-containing protein [Desulfuromonadaceae bacterium]|nr:HDOD domain-containing protein [Desulfuromonadaceae bacterium]